MRKSTASTSVLAILLAQGLGCSTVKEATHRASPGPPRDGRQAAAAAVTAPAPGAEADLAQYEAQFGPSADDAMAVSAAPVAGMRPRRAAAKRAGPRSAPRVAAAPLPSQAPPPPSAEPAQPLPAQQRKVHYDGYARLVAKRPRELLGRAEKLAKQAKGYVESLSGNRLVVRVPLAGFRALFEQILELSDVLQQRITARDITDAHQAVELRLRVLRASRARLMELLAKVFREHEKLALLGQIKRLTEQIDQLQLQLQELARLASYSRITVDAAPRPQPAAGLAQRDLGVFEWIARLSPFRRSVADACDRFELPVPEGMVELDHDDSFWSFLRGGDPWVAQSPDGVTVWTMQRDNNPLGSAQYWHDALRARLTRRYAAHESYRVGAFRLLELREEVGQRKYRYLVGVRVDDDELQVVEIYYPSEAHQQRHGEAIKRVLLRASGDRPANEERAR